MYTKMNALAVVGVLAAGVAGQASSAVAAASAMPAAMKNGTAPVWSYYNVTVSSVVVVQEYTTKCAEATTLTFNDCEYPATAGELIVVTNCPCTITTAVPTLTSSLCPPEFTKPAPPPVVEVVPSMHVTPTANTPVVVPSYPALPSTHAPPVQVGGASPFGRANGVGLVIAAIAVVFSL
ncbi:hypothetical protein F4802DRAFT_444619 [Xylaria palmicola]|nr:hypothetical protein F4802DRAFT_444619 [Xylaria palmicola]